MPMLKRLPLLITLGFFILTGCEVSPPLSSTSDSEVSSSQDISTTSGSDGTSVVEGSSQDSSSSTSLITSESQTSVDLKAYLQVVSITKQFNQTSRSAVIQVRLNGSNLTEALIIQGISLIANDFYEAEIVNIGIHRVELTIQVFDLVQALNTSPTYGDALFMINETDTLIGIQLKEARIILA
jgi:hypothetical protein